MDTKVIFKKGVILVVIASFLLWNLTAIAAPEGGSVAQGSATISQSATQTTVNQTSQSTVINWNSFNTASHEAVQFNQPNASSVALNRITSGLPTTFAGQLTANGHVWILNPAGVLFTSTSKIDVAGLVASTLNIKDSDFMAKNYKLEQIPGASQGSVINYGSINSHENGLVALVAPTVENHGSIVTNMGNVLLASGTVATLDPYGDNLINFAPNNYAVEGSVTNTGTIKTNGGKVVMAANSVNNIVKSVVNAGGIIEAKNISQGADGVIILGGNSGVTNVTGKITSNKIIIKGHDTKVSGELKTEQPGMIETSGHYLTVDSSSIINAGQGGLWLIDPYDVHIVAGNVLVNNDGAPGFGSTGTSQIGADLIAAQLNAGTSVAISTFGGGADQGNILIEAPIIQTTVVAPTVELRLSAQKDIYISADINLAGASLTTQNENGGVGNTYISANVTTGGYQQYTQAVVLTNDVTLKSTQPNGGFAPNYISFGKGVNGPYNLTVDVKNDVAQFGDPSNAPGVGNITKLASLTVGANDIQFYTQASQVLTTGDQTYHGQVTIRPIGSGPSINFISDNGTFSVVPSAAHSTVGLYSANVHNDVYISANNVYLSGEFGKVFSGFVELNALVVQSVAGVTTFEDLVVNSIAHDYKGAVNVIGGGAVIASPTGLVHFESTINGPGPLAISGTSVQLDNAVGNVTPLSNFSVATSGNFALNVGVTADSAAFYSSGAALSETASGYVHAGSLITNSVTGTTFNNTSNMVGTYSAVNSITGDIVFANTGNLLLDTITQTGVNLTVNNIGRISQINSAYVSGASTFNSGANAIDLNHAGNNLLGLISVNNTGNNAVTLVNDPVTQLGGSSMGGDFTVTSPNDITLNANITAGSQTYNGKVSVINTSALTSTLGDITFNDQIIRTNPVSVRLDINAAQDVNFNGDVLMDPTPMAPGLSGAYLGVTAGNKINIDTAIIDTGSTSISSVQTAYQFFSPVVLLQDVVVTSVQGTHGQFLSTIDGGFNLTTQRTSLIDFNGNIGSADPLASFHVMNPTMRLLGGLNAITTTGTQTYDPQVFYFGPSNVTFTGSTIIFNDGISGTGVNIAGDAVFNNGVNPYVLTGVLNVSGDATLNGATITSTALQDYDGGITVTSNNGTLNSSNTIAISGAINGPGALDITAATTLISGNVGGVPSLSSLTINGPSFFSGGIINANAQNYNGVVTVLSAVDPTHLNSPGTIHFLNNVEGPGGLVLVANTVQFDGNVGTGNELSLLDITAPVTFSGVSTYNAVIQNYRGPVTVVGAGATVNASGSVNFFDTVDGPGSLTLNAPVTQFTSIVGGTTPLNILTVLNDVILNGTTITANQEIFQGSATIGSNGATLISPDVQFLSTISGPGSLYIMGNLTASDDINIGGLTVTDTTLYNKGSNQNVITSHGQYYGDTVTLNNNLNIFNTGFGYINFGGGGVVGPVFDLSVINMSNTFVNGITGSVNVDTLTLGGTGGATLVNSVFNSLEYAPLIMGYYCVNGSCKSFNLDIPEKLIIPAISDWSNVVCDANGCRGADIEMNTPNLLRAYDPLSRVCVINIDGTVSCAGSSAVEE